MAISQKGASYKSREAVSNPPQTLKEFSRHLLFALDDIASQIQAVRSQGNFGQATSPEPPHPVNQVAVVNAGGFAQITLTHNSAPVGTRYTIQYSTTPNFLNPQIVDNGDSLLFERYLHGKTLYFRAAPKFLASDLAAWTYFGSATTPTPTTF